jgi:hypothetical protein
VSQKLELLLLEVCTTLYFELRYLFDYVVETDDPLFKEMKNLSLCLTN